MSHVASAGLRRTVLPLLAALVCGLGIWFVAREASDPAEGKEPKAKDAGRDWTAHPAIVEIDTPHDIYAVGDVHGDYERLVSLLVSARVIARDPGRPEKVEWNAGKAVLVCTGDLIDKSNHSLEVIALFRALADSAATKGGRVVVTMGNHEADFLAYPGKEKKAVEFIAELQARKLSLAEVAAGQDELGVGRFLCDLPFAARVNDWFFAHAGNTQGRTLQELRTELEAGVKKRGFRATILQDEDSLLEARLHPNPWWEKPGDAAGSKARLERYVEALGVKHLVIGHQPGKVVFADGSKRKAGKVHMACGGLVFLIDVGMSRAIGLSNGAVLHIQSGKQPRAVVLTPHDPPARLWP